eukprot:scaffold46207_cov51-Attheya_sp.AAC.2
MTAQDESPSIHASRRIYNVLRDAAAKAVMEEDVWGEFFLYTIPAERVIRHLYHHVHPDTNTCMQNGNRSSYWSTEDTIVKFEKTPFTHGAMRFCYRMKKLSTPPQSASNHRFHSYGWSRASNYVAKCYQIDGRVDTSEEAKAAVRNDIGLQYEANHWAEVFNKRNPPQTICFIRAYAIEFPDREGAPWFAVERYIAGKDSYGTGFIKHNTNAGFRDTEQRRKTPQVFSAHSFYASHGTRLVADIQGVGDLYTDPQVLSRDYQFGDGDLGPRGMALFFQSFRHCTYSDAMGIPVFPLSRNELKHQAKYNENDLTVSDDGDDVSSTATDDVLDSFARMDLNRQRRRSSLLTHRDILKMHIQSSTESESESAASLSAASQKNTVRRSNLTIPEHLRQSKSMLRKTNTRKSPFTNKTRSKDSTDEVQSMLQLATKDAVFDHVSFHRKASGEIRARHSQNDVMPGLVVAPPMIPNDECRANLGVVHYELACLHGMGRFPETISHDDNKDDDDDDMNHDVNSVVFHLAHAASLYHVPACISLARVMAGLDSTVSHLLAQPVVPIDFELAKELLQRAMDAPPSFASPSEPKASAGCLLFQILQNEHDDTNHDYNDDGDSPTTPTTTPRVIMGVLEQTLELLETAKGEAKDVTKHEERLARGGRLAIGDKVTANYAMEGSFYPGVVVEIHDDNDNNGGINIMVQFDDDGSTELLSVDHVKPLIPPTATTQRSVAKQQELDPFGHDDSDEKCTVEPFVLQAELAELKAGIGENSQASILFQQAAEEAMTAGKMKSATKWSLRAAELES